MRFSEKSMYLFHRSKSRWKSDGRERGRLRACCREMIDWMSNGLLELSAAYLHGKFMALQVLYSYYVVEYARIHVVCPSNFDRL